MSSKVLSTEFPATCVHDTLTQSNPSTVNGKRTIDREISMAIDLISVYDNSNPNKCPTINVPLAQVNSKVLANKNDQANLPDPEKWAKVISNSNGHKSHLRPAIKSSRRRKQFVLADLTEGFDLRKLLRSLSVKSVKETGAVAFNGHTNGTTAQLNELIKLSQLGGGKQAPEIASSLARTHSIVTNEIQSKSSNSFSNRKLSYSKENRTASVHSNRVNDNTQSSKKISKPIIVDSLHKSPETTIFTKHEVQHSGDGLDHRDDNSRQLTNCDKSCDLVRLADKTSLVSKELCRGSDFKEDATKTISTTSSTETIMADDQRVSVTKCVDYNSNEIYTQFKQKIDIGGCIGKASNKVEDCKHPTSKQSMELKSIMVSTLPLSKKYPLEQHNKVTLQDSLLSTDIVSDSVSKPLTDEDILEALRQVVRMCTKTDMSKRSTASEVYEQLEAKMKNLRQNI